MYEITFGYYGLVKKFTDLAIMIEMRQSICYIYLNIYKPYGNDKRIKYTSAISVNTG